MRNPLSPHHLLAAALAVVAAGLSLSVLSGGAGSLTGDSARPCGGRGGGPDRERARCSAAVTPGSASSRASDGPERPRRPAAAACRAPHWSGSRGAWRPAVPLRRSFPQRRQRRSPRRSRRHPQSPSPPSASTASRTIGDAGQGAPAGRGQAGPREVQAAESTRRETARPRQPWRRTGQPGRRQRPPGREVIGIPLTRRMRLAGALLLLSLPLAVGVWMSGNYAAQRERKNADQRLVAGSEHRGRRVRSQAQGGRRARARAGAEPGRPASVPPA